MFNIFHMPCEIPKAMFGSRKVLRKMIFSYLVSIYKIKQEIKY